MRLRRAYAVAEMPPVWRVLGARLVPMTPRHVMVLECLENPLSPLSDTEDLIGPSTVAQAVEVCRRSGKDAVRFFSRTRPWVMRLILRIRNGNYRWCAAPWQPLAQFISYRRFWAMDRPMIDDDEKGSSKSEVPGIWSMVSQRVLAGEDRETILDTPCRVLMWDSVFNADACRVLKVKDRTPARIKLSEMANLPMTSEEIQELLSIRKQHMQSRHHA